MRRLCINSYSVCLLLLVVLALTSCHKKRGMQPEQEPVLPVDTAYVADTLVAVPAAPAWRYCVVQGARATVQTGSMNMSTTCSMSCAHDSLVVISIMPLLGMEMYRVEATPAELALFDKPNRRYVVSSYDELNRYVFPTVHYEDIEALATGDIRVRMGGSTNPVVVTYSAFNHSVTLTLNYPSAIMTPELNPRIIALNRDRWIPVTLQQMLQ